MTALFITATGTGVGKTFVACGLARSLRAEGRKVTVMKPVVSGFNPADFADSDPALLLAACGIAPTLAGIARISPYRFRAPLSPDLAAHREGREINFDDLVATCQSAIAAREEALLIEGVGGVMVPLDRKHTVLDWTATLGLPLVLVTGSYLGTLSHTLTAMEIIARRRLAVSALVVSESADAETSLDDTAATLGCFLPGLRIVTLPRMVAGQIDERIFADILASPRSREDPHSDPPPCRGREW